MIRSSSRLLHMVVIASVALTAQGCRDKASVDTTAARTVADSTTTAPDFARLPVLAGVFAARPADEATRDSALAATRDSLLAIIARRDTAALVNHLDPDVKYSFGGDEGRDGFLEYWRTQYSMDALWHTLRDVLTHGGRFTGPTLFSAPWTFSALPDSLDAFTHLVVRDSLVPVRLAPRDTAAPIGTLSYVVVRTGASEEMPPDTVWRAIVLADDRTAFVPASQIRSPVDWRVGFGFRTGRWVIQYFVAGD